MFTPPAEEPEQRWELREKDGAWTVRHVQTMYITTGIASGDREAALAWAGSVVPDHPRRVISCAQLKQARQAPPKKPKPGRHRSRP